MVPVTGETNLLGKQAQDLQENIVVGETDITGTLKYVTGYTGFHGSDPEQQKGNYIAMKVNPTPISSNITVELVGGTKGPVKLDSDKMFVFRITNKDSQKIKVTVDKDKKTTTKTYSLSKLTLSPAG